MAIDIYFHSKLPLDETVSKLEEVESEFISIYEEDFLLYKARVSSALQKDIASDFNFPSEAKFIVSVNNKKRTAEIKDISLFFKRVFGDGNVLPLLDNESLIKQ